jgi:large subunit ribosomal protein L34
MMPELAIRTGHTLRLLLGLLPAGECSTGLWIPQGINAKSLSDKGDVTNDEASLRYTTAIKRTYQPKKRYRRRVHGFLRRMSTRGGARVMRDRRRKGRQRLTP